MPETLWLRPAPHRQGSLSRDAKRQSSLGALTFMRELFCHQSVVEAEVQATGVRFDIWAHHPYTSGGPTHKAALPDDLSLGDLPEMSRVLRAGVKVGNIVSPRPVEFWVTEFSWDTDPPTRQRCRSTSRPAGSPKRSIGCGARNQSRDLVLDS
jgi:hypothetical protein